MDHVELSLLDSAIEISDRGTSAVELKLRTIASQAALSHERLSPSERRQRVMSSIRSPMGSLKKHQHNTGDRQLVVVSPKSQAVQGDIKDL
jgi:hypothetical protein